jgi:hypothetical protein
MSRLGMYCQAHTLTTTHLSDAESTKVPRGLASSEALHWGAQATPPLDTRNQPDRNAHSRIVRGMWQQAQGCTSFAKP